MNIREQFPSAWLKAGDLNGTSHTVTIDRVEKAEMNDGASKPVVYFQNRTAGLVLNKTNAAILDDLFGPLTESWAGQPVVLRTEKVSYQGSMVDGIRLAAPAAQPTAPAAQPATQPAQPTAPAGGWKEADDVPF